ncbi:16S rRNA (cytosine(1402)-N(4))-methyltransferase RsmH [Litorimonas haliclonae]|uniref:16S rRNA (cytosine(1402)-N(4))-methyltransferase RsmH n=1 Tax=Litorimonas haliclonae TaxID=2081977 RepID=UPI0039EE62F6
MKHYPVMLPEVLKALSPQAGETYVDGTFGYGGYSEAILQAENCKVIGLDRDPNVAPRAAELAAEYGSRFRLIQTPFSKLDLLGLDPVDAVILDIGVSSMQLDEGARGFSFMRDGPLDMRMSQSGPTAADAVMNLSQVQLEQLFRVYGEEARARHAAKVIVQSRDDAPLTRTLQLADLLEKALGRRGKTHPATKVFQALRIFVNDELGELFRALHAAEQALAPEGRLIVVTFHSLEDRIVKTFFRERAGEIEGGSRYAPAVEHTGPPPSFSLPKRSVTKPSKTEIKENARSRSAKMRVAVRSDAAPWGESEARALRVPQFSDLEALL